MFIVSCHQCGEKFEAKTSRRMYCSDLCKNKGSSRVTCRYCSQPMYRGSGTAADGKAAHNSCRATAEIEHGTRKGYQVGKCRCAECVQWNRDQVKSYRLQRKAEGRPIRVGGGSGPWINPKVRAAVFERDNWTCRLCGEVLDRDADSQSDWFPSLDHILPQSLGGSHTLENLRAAHRWCNSIRGAKDFHQELFV